MHTMEDEFELYEEEVKKKTFFESKKVRSVLAFLLQIVLVIILAGIVSFVFCQSIVMQEGSMEPTVQAGDKLLIDRAIYKVSSPKRGDIIAFTNSNEKNASMHIKRIIGLPGEKIQIMDGMILINGETYKENKDFPAIVNGGLADTEIQLGPNDYFVLGDNRNNSEDSRFGDVGNVTSKNIVGKLWFVAAPFDHIGLLKN